MFVTRPDLSNTQFKQLSGSTLTLSGETDFVGILKSKSVEIDATLTGATSAITGSVLTFNGSKIILSPSSAGDNNFDGNRLVTRSGIPNVNVMSTTVKGFLEGYFFPSVPPVESINGGGFRLFGNNSGLTLNWTVIRKTLPITSITVNGLSVPSGFFSALPVNGSVSSGTTATITTPNTNQTYTINATTASESVNASTSIIFSNKRYFYGDNQELIAFSDGATSSNVNLNDVVGKSEFASTKVKSTFSITLSNQFFYYVYPTAFGTSIFTVNGLLNSDFTSKTFVFTNSFGFSSSFILYRSNNILNGTFNISVA